MYAGVPAPIPTTSFYVYKLSDGVMEQATIGNFGFLKRLVLQ